MMFDFVGIEVMSMPMADKYPSSGKTSEPIERIAFQQNIDSIFKYNQRPTEWLRIQ